VIEDASVTGLTVGADSRSTIRSCRRVPSTRLRETISTLLCPTSGKGDERGAVSALFYAAEAAVVALADVHGSRPGETTR